MNGRCYFGLVLGALLLAPSLPALSATPVNMLIYINPQEYTHPVRLWQFYADYWFEQGPVVEPLATSALTAAYGEVAMCGASSSGRALVWLTPVMYYNPHMQTYYGQITVRAFSGSGEFMGEYVGEASKRGYIDVYPGQQVSSVYKMALQSAVDEMQKDARLQALVSDGAETVASNAACDVVAGLPARKPIALDYFIKPVN